MKEETLRKLLGIIAGGAFGAKGGKPSGLSGGVVGAVGGLFTADLVNAATRGSTQPSSPSPKSVPNLDAMFRELLEMYAVAAATGSAGTIAMLDAVGVDIEGPIAKFDNDPDPLSKLRNRLPEMTQTFETTFRIDLENLSKHFESHGVSIDVEKHVRAATDSFTTAAKKRLA